MFANIVSTLEYYVWSFGVPVGGDHHLELLVSLADEDLRPLLGQPHR